MKPQPFYDMIKHGYQRERKRKTMSKGLILAAGLDPGFQMDIPKQFVIVDNRPIIVYTLQAFQRHPEIDEIVEIGRAHV